MSSPKLRAHTDPKRSIASLVVEKADRAGPNEIQKDDEIPIYPVKQFLVGRATGPDSIVITHRMVSKDHFRIYNIIYEEEDDLENPPLIYCEDLESTNGTWVNDTLIGKIGHPKKGFLLGDGDLIEIKPHWAFRFHQNLSGIGKDTDSIREAEKQHFADRYNIKSRVLGSGLSGTVYLAEDKATKTQLACKIVDLRIFNEASPGKETLNGNPISSEPVRDENSPEFIKPDLPVRRPRKSKQLKDLKRELHILTKLDHPNVVSLKKAFMSKNTLYLFQELATGGDLFSYLCQNGGVLNDLHSRIICRQVALAIQYLHAQGVVHRDLKPENILVTHSDIGHRVLVTDFGCAITVKNKTERLQTQTGTAGYMAPEMIAVRRNGGYTKAIDMWSLGVVTTCLLTGAYDFLTQAKEDDAKSDVISGAVQRNLEDLAEAKGHWEKLGRHARDFIRKLLTLDVEERMTADEAINHSWFTKPQKVAWEMDQLYKRANKHWRPQEETKLFEEIPNVVETSEFDREKSALRKRHKWFRRDSKVSKYWTAPTLHRHLSPTKPSMSERRAIIKHLQKPSSPMFVSEIPSSIRDLPPEVFMTSRESPSKSRSSRSRASKTKCAKATNLFDQIDLPDSQNTFPDKEQQPLMELNSKATNSRSNTIIINESQQDDRQADLANDLDENLEVIPDSQENIHLRLNTGQQVDFPNILEDLEVIPDSQESGDPRMNACQQVEDLDNDSHMIPDSQEHQDIFIHTEEDDDWQEKQDLLHENEALETYDTNDKRSRFFLKQDSQETPDGINYDDSMETQEKTYFQDDQSILAGNASKTLQDQQVYKGLPSSLRPFGCTKRRISNELVGMRKRSRVY